MKLIDLAGLTKISTTVVNDVWSVGLVADYDEISNSSLRLNIAKEWFNNIDKVGSVITSLNSKSCALVALSIESVEQATNVDSIKGRCE